MPPPVFCTITGSPFRAFSKNQRPSSVLTFRQPWLTFVLPCAHSDHGAACTKMPLLEMRVAYST